MPRTSSILDISCISRESRTEELLIAAQQCGVVLSDLYVSKIAYSLAYASQEAQRGRLAWQEKMAPNLDPNVKDDVFKRLGDTEGARRATEASRAAGSGHGHEITHPLKKYKRGGGTLPNLYFLRVSS